MGAYRKKVQIVILILVVLIGGFAIGNTLFRGDSKIPGVGDSPPGFSLFDLNGNAHNLSDYEGKPMVITFWGTFCPPCVKELPEFQRLYDKWHSKGLEVLAINLSEADLPVQNFVSKFDLSFTVLRDVNRKVERQYGLRSYPTTFFVKPDGTISEIAVTAMTEQQIQERVEKLF
ncbi:redoxin domain-containing protein [Paenibacillus pinihumi]|uniref:redoxin domain-containing protein n=1 Tax=Paenibacillus pinihumi TaxID=669462 RepID=UPI0003FB15C7|nr:redoxin domain-containing protein [Paenibacillus pinihumi]